MPVYEYRCAGCGHAFSKLFRSHAAVGSVACPSCGRAEAERAISGFAYHQSLKMQIEALDPRYEKEAAWAEETSVRKAAMDTADPFRNLAPPE